MFKGLNREAAFGKGWQRSRDGLGDLARRRTGEGVQNLSPFLRKKKLIYTQLCKLYCKSLVILKSFWYHIQ